MAFLPLDLDGKKKIPKVAKVAGFTPGDVLWGLAELWEYTWNTKSPVVSELVLDGCFGPGERIRAALVAFDFLEPVDGGWRVRGAEKWLGVSTAQSVAGKTRAAGPRNNRGQLISISEPARAGALEPAPTSSYTQHPTPNTHKEKTEETVAAFELKPDSSPIPRKRSAAQGFWDWAQGERTSHTGLIREAEPKPEKLNSWFRRVLGELGGADKPLGVAWARYLLKPADNYWRDRGFPFKGFMSDEVWRRYMPAATEAA